MSRHTDEQAQPPLILIAEDSRTQAEQLCHFLEQNGYQVVATANGREALASLQQHKPALVISDIVMPEMDGYALCEAIKADARTREIPVILVTTLSDPQDVIRALKCHADNFVTKPYEPQFLVARIESLLHRSVSELDQDTAMVLANGERHTITASRGQILRLLLSTYEAAMQRNRALQQARNELRAANDALEGANKELEAFSYSVSHDLRAPLRVIDGFTHCVLEDETQKLDDHGRKMLLRVRSACARMNQLIDDLLMLARVTRGELQRQAVDLTQLARSVIAGLQAQEAQRRVQVTIADGLMAHGDARLMQIVLENLLGNAWKFTSRKPQAIIEMGTTLQRGQRVYFVRDNGAGFDMTYAQRLFGAFQRFHGSDEFPGTGIGLATVHRIIKRHGGQIWADSRVGEGTTFYFTLDRSPEMPAAPAAG